MKKFKIKYRTVHLDVEIPFEIGQVTGTAIVSVNFDSDVPSGINVEFDDVENVMYMNMPIDGYKGWRKLTDFHNEIGIDLNKLIDNYISNVLKPDDIIQIMNENK